MYLPVISINDLIFEPLYGLESIFKWQHWQCIQYLMFIYILMKWIWLLIFKKFIFLPHQKIECSLLHWLYFTFHYYIRCIPDQVTNVVYEASVESSDGGSNTRPFSLCNLSNQWENFLKHRRSGMPLSTCSWQTMK